MHSKKGFISVYIIFIFLIINTLSITIFTVSALKFKTLYNIKIAHKYLNQEIIVIKYIKCLLLNDELNDSEYSVNNLKFTVEKKENLILVKIAGEYHEEISIIINENNVITDYSTYTNNLKGI